MGADSAKSVDVSIRPRNDSNDSSNSNSSLKSPRTPRFAEATSVDSPIEPSARSRNPFAERDDDDDDGSEHFVAHAQPADVGFGYIGQRASAQSVHIGRAIEMPMTPKSPLKSALKSPGAPPRRIEQNPLSPTWQEEDKLAEEEKVTEKEQAKDLKVKLRVRIAKMALRFTNFSCSLIVLSMMSTTFQIFNETKLLPARNNLPPWASNTQKWPAITLLCISCVSLLMAVIIFYGYWRGGHRRAEKAAAYYSMFAIGYFTFNIIMWGIGAAALQSAKNNSGGVDIWGWSCKDNQRKTLFQEEVHYALVCRLQNWSLLCGLIEIVVEIITIVIYAVVFYRFYSKRRLRKTMEKRDTARNDLYLAQLRSQSAPNTPGARGPLSPSEGGYNPLYSPRFATSGQEKQNVMSIDELSHAEEGIRYINAPVQPPMPKPFTLQTPPPPKKSTPKLNQNGFESSPPTSAGPSSTPKSAFAPNWPIAAPIAAPVPESKPVHMAAAPGEQQYDSVPIPGAYSSPINSPTHPPNTAQGAFFAPLR